MSGHAHGLAISSMQRWHHRVVGAAAGNGSAPQIIVYLCFV